MIYAKFISGLVEVIHYVNISGVIFKLRVSLLPSIALLVLQVGTGNNFRNYSGN